MGVLKLQNWTMQDLRMTDGFLGLTLWEQTVTSHSYSQRMVVGSKYGQILLNDRTTALIAIQGTTYGVCQ